MSSAMAIATCAYNDFKRSSTLTPSDEVRNRVILHY